MSPIITQAMCFLITMYQKCISPFLGPRCRFYPSCSSYALLALKQAGPMVGSALAIKRICKCHSFHPGGVDFPPQV